MKKKRGWPKGKKRGSRKKKTETEKIIANKELLASAIKGSQDLKKGNIVNSPEVVVSVVSKPKEDLEPLQKIVLGGPNDDVRKSREDILECGSAMIELIKMPIWYKWIKPQILNDAVDFIRKTLMLSGEKRDESAGGYNYTKKLLKTVDRWIADYTYIIREIEKEAIKKKQGGGVK